MAANRPEVAMSLAEVGQVEGSGDPRLSQMTRNFIVKSLSVYVEYSCRQGGVGEGVRRSPVGDSQ